MFFDFETIWGFVAVAMAVGLISSGLVGCLAEFWRGRNFGAWFVGTLAFTILWYIFAYLMQMFIALGLAVEGHWHRGPGPDLILMAVSIVTHAMPFFGGLVALVSVENRKPFS